MNEYHAGYPEKRGVYLCKVDGKDTYLTCHRCDITGRSWWTDLRGYDVVGYKVEWIGKPVTISAE